jgi:hypothetical protein
MKVLVDAPNHDDVDKISCIIVIRRDDAIDT